MPQCRLINHSINKVRDAMCGIVGFLNFNDGASVEAVTLMADAVIHRGPDSHAVWSEGPVALGHRRLAIIDLSPAGAQPMTSSCGRFVVVFNGEIYNYAIFGTRLKQIPTSLRG